MEFNSLYVLSRCGLSVPDVSLYLVHSQGIQMIVTLWFGFIFAVWHWTLHCLPGRNIRCRHL